MEFQKMTPVIVQQYHYDLGNELASKSKVNMALRQVFDQSDEEIEKGDSVDGTYFEIAIHFDVVPHPGEFEIAGLITQVLKFKDYFGDGTDLGPANYQLLSRPLIEEIETLTYQVTQITMEEPVNLSFEPNFNNNNQ